MAHLFCSGDFVTVVDVGGEKVLKVQPAALTLLAEEAFIDVAHLLRPAHLQVMLQVCYNCTCGPQDMEVKIATR